MEQAISAANRELEQRHGDALATIMTSVLAQRDAALRALHRERAEAVALHARLLAGQDRFLGKLAAEHEAELSALEAEVEQLKDALDRAHGAAVGEAAKLIEAAYAEIEESRADAARLQGERDEAFRRVDDIRLELDAEADLVRDQVVALEAKLDDAQRELEDAHDAAREEAERWAEEREAILRERDERIVEMRRFSNRAGPMGLPPGRGTLPGV